MSMSRRTSTAMQGQRCVARAGRWQTGLPERLPELETLKDRNESDSHAASDAAAFGFTK